MKLLIIIIAAVVAIVLWMWLLSGRYARKLFNAAQKAEATGNFKHAVFLYGEALSNYYKPAEDCRKHILRLWESYGPFDYSKELAEFDSRTDIDRDGDREIFQETLNIINQVASGKIEKRAWED